MYRLSPVQLGISILVVPDPNTEFSSSNQKSPNIIISEENSGKHHLE